jgi:hypothetical protein
MGYVPNMKQLFVVGAVGLAAMTASWGAAAQQATDREFQQDYARCDQIFNALPASRRDDNAVLNRSTCRSQALIARDRRITATSQQQIQAGQQQIQADRQQIQADRQQIDRNRLEAACVREVTRAVQEGIVTRERVAAYIAGRDLDTVGGCNLRNAVLPRAPAGQR